MAELPAVLLFLLGVAVGLGVLIRYELLPGRRVAGTVTRVWWEQSDRFRLYRIEVESDGVRRVYGCDPGEFGKARVGIPVRLHVKGSYVEYLRVIGEADV